MKFFCNTQELSDALTVVSKALSPKCVIPVLSGIKIVAEGDTLTLSATDMEIFIEKKIKAEILIEGKTVVTGRFFVDYIKKLSSIDRIEFEMVNKDKMIFKYGESKGDVQCLNEENYPEIMTFNDDNTFKIQENHLKDVLDGTLFCASIDDSRPVLKAAFIEIEKGNINVVALDGFRLGICNRPIYEQNNCKNILINSRILNEIARVLTESTEKILVKIQRNKILFDLNHTKIVTMLQEGEYIQYRKILPTKSECSFTVKKQEILDCLDRALLLSRTKNNNYVKLSISDQLTLDCNSEIGSVNEKINIKKEGKDIDIAFSCRYLAEALTRIKEDYVVFYLTNATSPALIKPISREETENNVYLVLSVRMIG